MPQAVVDRRQYLAEPSRVAQDDVLIGRVHASGDRPQVQVADAGHARHRGHCRPHLFGIDPAGVPSRRMPTASRSNAQVRGGMNSPIPLSCGIHFLATASSASFRPVYSNP